MIRNVLQRVYTAGQVEFETRLRTDTGIYVARLQTHLHRDARWTCRADVWRDIGPQVNAALLDAAAQTVSYLYKDARLYDDRLAGPIIVQFVPLALVPEDRLDWTISELLPLP